MTAPVSAPLVAVRRAIDVAALTAWINASLAGGASADDVSDAADAVGLRQVRGDGGRQTPLLELAALRGEGRRRAVLVLPAPGDVLGLTGPAAVNRQALRAGAAIVISAADGASAAVLVPDEPDWARYDVALPPAAVAAWPTVRQARSEFAEAITHHADAIGDLDVAADTQGLRAAVLAADDQPLPPLPPTLDAERRALLGRARLVALSAAAAAVDDGASVSASEASSRARHLRELGAVSRRAIAAAVSGS